MCDTFIIQLAIFSLFRTEFPAWAIAVIVICAVFLFLVCMGFVLCAWRRYRSLKAEVVEVVYYKYSLHTFRLNIQVHLESGHQIMANNERSLLYLPRISDEWEIERRLVSINYSTKLGEGAFGSVHLGTKYCEIFCIFMALLTLR